RPAGGGEVVHHVPALGENLMMPGQRQRQTLLLIKLPESADLHDPYRRRFITNGQETIRVAKMLEHELTPLHGIGLGFHQIGELHRRTAMTTYPGDAPAQAQHVRRESMLLDEGNQLLEVSQLTRPAWPGVKHVVVTQIFERR